MPARTALVALALVAAVTLACGGDDGRAEISGEELAALTLVREPRGFETADTCYDRPRTEPGILLRAYHNMFELAEAPNGVSACLTLGFDLFDSQEELDEKVAMWTDGGYATGDFGLVIEERGGSFEHLELSDDDLTVWAADCRACPAGASLGFWAFFAERNVGGETTLFVDGDADADYDHWKDEVIRQARDFQKGVKAALDGVGD